MYCSPAICYCDYILLERGCPPSSLLPTKCSGGGEKGANETGYPCLSQKKKKRNRPGIDLVSLSQGRVRLPGLLVHCRTPLFFRAHAGPESAAYSPAMIQGLLGGVIGGWTSLDNSFLIYENEGILTLNYCNQPSTKEAENVHLYKYLLEAEIWHQLIQVDPI